MAKSWFILLPLTTDPKGEWGVFGRTQLKKKWGWGLSSPRTHFFDSIRKSQRGEVAQKLQKKKGERLSNIEGD